MGSLKEIGARHDILLQHMANQEDLAMSRRSDYYNGTGNNLIVKLTIRKFPVKQIIR